MFFAICSLLPVCLHEFFAFCLCCRLRPVTLLHSDCLTTSKKFVSLYLLVLLWSFCLIITMQLSLYFCCHQRSPPALHLCLSMYSWPSLFISIQPSKYFTSPSALHHVIFCMLCGSGRPFLIITLTIFSRLPYFGSSLHLGHDHLVVALSWLLSTFCLRPLTICCFHSALRRLLAVLCSSCLLVAVGLSPFNACFVSVNVCPVQFAVQNCMSRPVCICQLVTVCWLHFLRHWLFIAICSSVPVPCHVLIAIPSPILFIAQ